MPHRAVESIGWHGDPPQVEPGHGMLELGARGMAAHLSTLTRAAR